MRPELSKRTSSSVLLELSSLIALGFLRVRKRQSSELPDDRQDIRLPTRLEQSGYVRGNQRTGPHDTNSH